jgi:lipoprotein NlpI
VQRQPVRAGQRLAAPGSHTALAPNMPAGVRESPGRRHHALCAAALWLAAAGAAAQATEAELRCGDVSRDPRLAIEVCTRWIEHGQLGRAELAHAYYTRGAEWAALGNHERAVGDYNVALQLDPDFVAAYYNRALSWAVLGDPDRAIDDYDVVLKRTPRDVNAWLGRAVEWIVKGDYPRAVRDFDSALKLDGKSAAAYFGRARARYYAGDFQAAVADFERAHRLDPSTYSALWLYFARRRAGLPAEKTLAADAGTQGKGEWPAEVVALYLGRLEPEALLRSAEAVADAETRRSRRCEAVFYVGKWHVLRGAREPALPLLREAEAHCPRTFLEHEGAVAELRRLKG